MPSSDSNPLRFSNFFEKARGLRNRVNKELDGKNINSAYQRFGKKRAIVVSYAHVIVGTIVIKEDPDNSGKLVIECRPGNKRGVEIKYQKDFASWDMVENEVINWLKDIVGWLENICKNTNTAR